MLKYTGNIRGLRSIVLSKIQHGTWEVGVLNKGRETFAYWCLVSVWQRLESGSSFQMKYNTIAYYLQLCFVRSIPFCPNDCYLSAGRSFCVGAKRKFHSIFIQLLAQFKVSLGSFIELNSPYVLAPRFIGVAKCNKYILYLIVMYSICTCVPSLVKLFSKTLTRNNTQRIIISFVLVFSIRSHFFPTLFHFDTFVLLSA